MLQPTRITFTALSFFETNIYQRVFLRGRTHANKAVTENVLLPDGHDALLNLHDQNIIFCVFSKRNQSNDTTTRWSPLPKYN